MDERGLKKIQSMSTDRLVSLLYALVKSWEKNWPETFDEANRVDAFLNELADRESRFSRFIAFTSKVSSLQDLVSLSVFLEREQKLNLKDEDILDENPHQKDQLLKASNKIELYFILDDIRSAFNIGSVFRLAECIGVKKIFLCGYTASPNNAKIEKSAMGTEQLVDWEYHPKKNELFRELKKEEIEILALETLASAKSYTEYKSQSKKLALWVGNERFGIELDELDQAHQVLQIPLYGSKNSLNVAQALSVVGFHFSNQLRLK